MASVDTANRTGEYSDKINFTLEGIELNSLLAYKSLSDCLVLHKPLINYEPFFGDSTDDTIIILSLIVRVAIIVQIPQTLQ